LIAAGGFAPSQRGLRLACAALALAPIVALPVAAEPAPQEHVHLFAGYSYLHSGSADLHGFQASASYPAWREIRIVGDVAMQFGSFAGADLTEYEVLLGVRHDWKLDRFRPYAEVLIGLAHHSESFATPEGDLESGGTHFAFGPGIGTDYRFTPSWRARVGLSLLFVSAGGWETSPRISAGVVYVFGARRP